MPGNVISASDHPPQQLDLFMFCSGSISRIARNLLFLFGCSFYRTHRVLGVNSPRIVSYIAISYSQLNP